MDAYFCRIGVNGSSLYIHLESSTSIKICPRGSLLY